VSILLPTGRWTADNLADYIEASVLFSSNGAFARASLRDDVEEDFGTDDLQAYDGDDASLHDLDDLDDLEPSGYSMSRLASAEGTGIPDYLSTDAFIVLEDRAAIVGERYPFAVQPDLIIRKSADWRDYPSYSFMIALNARFVHGLSAETNQPARMFERLVGIAMGEYINGAHEHFGWPRDGSGAERSFENALPVLLRNLGERLTISAEDIPAKIKDNEVDVFAWRSIGDKRRGQLILACQCAIGEGWQNKGIRLAKWEPFVTFAVSPVTAAAFPFVPAAMTATMKDIDYEYLSKCVGLWFDRLRLAIYLDDHKIPEQLRVDMVGYVERLIDFESVS
jgi:hypothetical protein